MDVLLQRHVALVSAEPDVNILQLCVVRMLWLPVVLVLLRFGVALTMLISFVIWMLANAAGESWHFNPLTWQLLFTTGIVAADLTQRNGVTARRECSYLASFLRRLRLLRGRRRGYRSAGCRKHS